MMSTFCGTGAISAAYLFVAASPAMSGNEPMGPSAPELRSTYVSFIRAELLAPVQQGKIDGRRVRFIPISADGLTDVNARYALKASDGTVIDIVNAEVRAAPKEIIDRFSGGEDVDPRLCYFRTSPRFMVSAGPHGWLRRSMFVARGIRMPDHVVVDFYNVE
jgi:hypothetical protein